MVKKHLLIVDDDERIRKLLKKFLTKYGYRVSTAGNACIARELNQYIEFDMLIVDIMMPGEDGLSLTRFLSNSNKAPILLLSAKVETSEKILGLEMGADDYLPKPFEPKELLLRINNIIKKSKKIDINKINKIGEAKIDLNKMFILLKDKKNKINNSEKKVLLEMLSNPGKTYSRIQIGQISNITQVFFPKMLQGFLSTIHLDIMEIIQRLGISTTMRCCSFSTKRLVNYVM